MGTHAPRAVKRFYKLKALAFSMVSVDGLWIGLRVIVIVPHRHESPHHHENPRRARRVRRPHPLNLR